MEKVVSPRLKRVVNDVVTNREDSLSQFWNEVETQGTPLIEAVPGSDAECYVTFLYRSSSGVDNVVVFFGPTNFYLDGRMTLLDNTDIWYKTYRLQSNARFMYQLSVNDSLVPLTEIVGKVLKGQEVVKRGDSTFYLMCREIRWNRKIKTRSNGSGGGKQILG